MSTETSQAAASCSTRYLTIRHSTSAHSNLHTKHSNDGPATGPGYDAPREAGSSRGRHRRGARLRVRDDGGRHRLEVPVRGRATSATAASIACSATPTSCPCSRPSSWPAGAFRSSIGAKPRRTTATSTRSLTMYLMRVAAWFSGNDYASFFYANAVLLLGFAMVTALCLWLLGGSRALWFALAPTLLVYGTINWDLAAVALRDGRPRRVREATGRLGGRADRARCRDEVLPGAGARAAVPAGAAGSGAGSLGASALVVGGHVGRDQPAVRGRRARPVVGVLQLQRRRAHPTSTASGTRHAVTSTRSASRSTTSTCSR